MTGIFKTRVDFWNDFLKVNFRSAKYKLASPFHVCNLTVIVLRLN